jgi:uncharacterized protein (TIGR02145 family)
MLKAEMDEPLVMRSTKPRINLSLTAATNESGFTALPGGFRWTIDFIDLGFGGYWWSSTEDDVLASVERSLHYSYGIISGGAEYKKYGYSVRCIRINE